VSLIIVYITGSLDQIQLMSLIIVYNTGSLDQIQLVSLISIYMDLVNTVVGVGRLDSGFKIMKIYPHRVKLYRIGCVGSDLLLVKALSL